MPVMVNAEESGERISPESARWALGDGDMAMIAFAPDEFDPPESVEVRLWFRVTRASDGDYTGELVGVPAGCMLGVISMGDEREFAPCNVFSCVDGEPGDDY